MVLRHNVIDGKPNGNHGSNVSSDHRPSVLAGSDKQYGAIQRNESSPRSGNRQRPSQYRIVRGESSHRRELVRSVTSRQNLQRNKKNVQRDFHPVIVKVRLETLKLHQFRIFRDPEVVATALGRKFQPSFVAVISSVMAFVKKRQNVGY